MGEALPVTPPVGHPLGIDELSTQTGVYRVRTIAAVPGGVTHSHELDQYADGIRRRSDAAFRALYEATADDLASFAYGMLRDRSAAEDAVQQAFLELARSSDKLRGGGEAIRVWLFRSVRFTCLDEIRRAGRRPVVVAGEMPEVGEYTDPLDHEVSPEVDRALGSLSDRQRAMVVLRHVVGLSGAEVARVMGMTRAAAYAALGRAERTLRRALDERDRP